MKRQYLPGEKANQDGGEVHGFSRLLGPTVNLEQYKCEAGSIDTDTDTETESTHASIVVDCMNALGYCYFPDNDDGVCFGAAWLLLMAVYTDDLGIHAATRQWLNVYQSRLNYIKEKLNPLIQEAKLELQKNEYPHINLDACADDKILKEYHIKIQNKLKDTIGLDIFNDIHAFFDSLSITADPVRHVKLFKKKFLFEIMMECKIKSLEKLKLPDEMEIINQHRDEFLREFKINIQSEITKKPNIYSNADCSLITSYIAYLEMQKVISFHNFENAEIPQAGHEVDLLQGITKSLALEMNQSDILLVKNIINLYTYEKIRSFLSLLLNQLYQTPLPISLGLMIGNKFHSAALVVHPQIMKDRFLYFDIENGEYTYLDVETCAYQIINSFRNKEIPFDFDRDTLALCFSCYCPSQYFDQFKFFMDAVASHGAEVISHAELCQRDHWGESYLDIIVDYNEIDLASRILPHCSNLINHVDSGGSTLLNNACEKNWFDMAKLLLTHGADPNQETTRGTPLGSAAMGGFFDIVQLLLCYHANMNLVSNGELPIVLAAVNKHFEITMLLASNSSQKNYTDTILVNQAVRHHHLPALDFFIKKGCSLNKTTANGMTPLFLAISDNDMNAVQILLQAGAAVDQPGKDGKTPLYLAGENKNLGIIKLLFQFGADLTPSFLMDNQKQFFMSYQSKPSVNPGITLFSADNVVTYLKEVKEQYLEEVAKQLAWNSYMDDLTVQLRSQGW